MSRINRRQVVGSLLGGAALPVVGCSGQKTYSGTPRFDHGVASGDPLADRVILWTRVSGVTAGSIDVDWVVATDAAMQRVIRRGRAETGPERDFTVKVDADRLPAAAQLYYRFSAGNSTSIVGRTRTLATGVLDEAKFAVVSCANHPYGYFHVYREIAESGDLDAVLHLGDYIYEYGMGEYATERAEALGRIPVPDHRLVTLDHYRLRHAQYKSDPDSRAMHAAHPLIAVWDDHELANDAWRDGAENHGSDDGSWPARRDAAIQAWLEWMPVRVSHGRDSTRIFRRYRYGDLLSLVMLDT
ncbi:MAG: alkaline phosphatase D family protein, partial [Woeseiaceae bacterium]|nr:alkaline phosphatase D family protein [Woeseiaceae bacterium]